HFKRPPANAPEVRLSMHQEVHRLSVRASSAPRTEVKVKGWDAAGKRPLVGAATPPARDPVSFPGSTGSALGEATDVATAQLRPATDNEARQLAGAIAARRTTSATVADGELDGDPAIVPRSVVTITDHQISGTFAVTRCEHRFGPDGYT